MDFTKMKHLTKHSQLNVKILSIRFRIQDVGIKFRSRIRAARPIHNNGFRRINYPPVRYTFICVILWDRISVSFETASSPSYIPTNKRIRCPLLSYEHLPPVSLRCTTTSLDYNNLVTLFFFLFHFYYHRSSTKMILQRESILSFLDAFLISVKPRSVPS